MSNVYWCHCFVFCRLLLDKRGEGELVAPSYREHNVAQFCVLLIHLLFRKKKDLQAVFDCLDFEQHTLDFTVGLHRADFDEALGI